MKQKEPHKNDDVRENKGSENGGCFRKYFESSAPANVKAVDRARDNKESPQQEVGKTVSFSDTQIDISDSENERESIVNEPNNPRITISEAVDSPCESDKAKVGGCPIYIYYGIKSYLHHFYQPPDKEALKSGELVQQPRGYVKVNHGAQEDDFHFLVEPGVRRWRGWWLRAGLWIGVNLMLVGVIAMLVGHLTTPRQTVVGTQANYTILDRWAVAFNTRLVACQLAGLAGFTCGAVIVMVALLVSSYQQEQSHPYCVLGATVMPETFVANPLAGPRRGWAPRRIPLTGSLTGVQPQSQPQLH